MIGIHNTITPDFGEYGSRRNGDGELVAFDDGPLTNGHRGNS